MRLTSEYTSGVHPRIVKAPKANVDTVACLTFRHARLEVIQKKGVRQGKELYFAFVPYRNIHTHPSYKLNASFVVFAPKALTLPTCSEAPRKVFFPEKVENVSLSPPEPHVPF